VKTSQAQLSAVRKWKSLHPEKQAQYELDWARRNPQKAQARKNAWAKTPKGRAAAKRRQKAHNEYRRAWRARIRAQGGKPS
jgi:hypothetical protein